MQTPNLLNLLNASNIVIYMLVFTRLTGLMQSAPFISTIQAPMMTKIWFSATIAFIFYPLIRASNQFIIPKSMPEFIVLIAIEFLVGYLIGFVANLIIEGVRMTGSMLSIQMALSMSEALDPATGVSSTEISRIYVYLTTLIIIATGAYQLLFTAIYNSYSAIPMGVIPLMDSNLISSLIQLFVQSFKIAFGVALPIYSVLLISDILLGMMSKMMPQMNIYMVAIPVKIYIGLILIVFLLERTSTFLQGVVQKYLHAINVLFT